MLSELVQRACAELPEGWQIVISLEQGCAGVELSDDYCEDVAFDTADKTIEEQVAEALRIAKERATA